jgi:hypothetical protein
MLYHTSISVIRIYSHVLASHTNAEIRSKYTYPYEKVDQGWFRCNTLEHPLPPVTEDPDAAVANVTGAGHLLKRLELLDRGTNRGRSNRRSLNF